jgi:hypothetical protein
MRRATLAYGLACSLSLLAGSARAGDPARDLGDLKPAESRDLDEAATAEPRDVEEVLADDPAEADVVDSRGVDSADTAQPGEAKSVAPTSLDDADRAPAWEPPPCEEVETAPPSLPGAEDAAGWTAALSDAQAKLDAAKARLTELDDDYTYARNRQKPRGEALAKIVADREAARSEYARARCALPDLVERARRAGVSADVWRSYPASLP